MKLEGWKFLFIIIILFASWFGYVSSRAVMVEGLKRDVRDLDRRVSDLETGRYR